jgi:hypothetical protein
MFLKGAHIFHLVTGGDYKSRTRGESDAEAKRRLIAHTAARRREIAEAEAMARLSILYPKCSNCHEPLDSAYQSYCTACGSGLSQASDTRKI